MQLVEKYKDLQIGQMIEMQVDDDKPSYAYFEGYEYIKYETGLEFVHFTASGTLHEDLGDYNIRPVSIQIIGEGGSMWTK